LRAALLGFLGLLSFLELFGMFGLFGILVVNPTSAQRNLGQLYEVFLDPDAQQVYFVDALSGLSTVIRADGSQHVVVNNGVLFQEAETGFPRLIAPNSSTVLTWIQPASDAVNVQWIASPNGRRLAWSVIQQTSAGIITELHTARSDGTQAALITKLPSPDSLAATPLAVTDDGRVLFYTLQALPSPRLYLAFPVAADVFRLEVETGRAERLPNEPLCRCAAGFSPNGAYYARLTPEGDGSGFFLRLRTVGSPTETVFAPIDNLTHTQAGALLIAPDGSRVVYASARGLRPGRSERYALILADRTSGQQTLLTDALTVGVRPVAFTPGGEGVIAVGLTQAGTYKLTFKNRELRQVSAYSWLGQYAP
jgi:hypothetical protein